MILTRQEYERLLSLARMSLDLNGGVDRADDRAFLEGLPKPGERRHKAPPEHDATCPRCGSKGRACAWQEALIAGVEKIPVAWYCDWCHYHWDANGHFLELP